MNTSDAIVIPPDEYSSARLSVAGWTEGVPLIEMIAEDIETQARLRLDLSTTQAHQLATALLAAQLMTN